MNELTKFLIKELLDEPTTVAIYGGGFKPPTKGHFNVAKQILDDFPEIDELKIFVGGGVRDGITQDESLQVWNIYKNYLSDKVSIEPSVAPVKSVLGYAKENPNTKVYWVLGAREGEESDLTDIASRTKSISKYPNLEVKVITSKGGVSGTKTRQALKAGNKEQFFSLIPDIKEKEQIWDIVHPSVKEEITPDQIKQADAFADKQLAPIDIDLTSKHVFDRLTGRDSDVTLAQLIGFFKRLGRNKKEFFDFFKKYKEIVVNDKTTNLNIPFLNMTNKAIAKTIMRKDNFLSSSPKLVFEVGEASLKPYKWEEVDAEGYYVYVHFVTNSETQYDVDIKKTIYFPSGQMDSVPALEIEFLAKPKDAQGSSAKVVVNKGELYKVMATLSDIIKKYLKKFKAQAIIYSPSKKSSEESFGTQRDNLYRAFISKAFPGTTFKKSGDDITAILPNNMINEGRYDSITRLVVKDIIDSWKSQFEGKEGELRFEEDYELENSKGQPIDFELLAVLKLEETEDKTYIVDGGANEELDPPYLEVTFQVDPRNLPKMWSTIYNDLIDVVRHEIEHLTQAGTNVIPSKEMADDQSIRQMINWGLLPQAEYFKLEKEVDAMLQGMYLKAKKSKTPFKDVIDNYFEKVGLEGEDKQDVLDLWTKRLKVLNLPSIQETVTATQVICDNCGWEWDKADGGKDLYICHKCGHDNTPKKEDPFGLNELAKTFVKEVFEKDWNLQDGMLSLTKYMIDNGMNITPLPKIKVIKDDKENASNLLGKTAYYNPADKSITLYTMDRHPKDILRSFSHEMIHHEQNLDNRLNNINTTNTNEDGDLPEIEREAYEKGNMIFRNWEDNIKAKKYINECILDIPKFNQPKTFVDKLRESLHEITLSKNNSVEIHGDLNKGKFQVGDIVYNYSIIQMKNPYNDEGKFYNIAFHPQDKSISTPLQGKENYIKILSTMYKVILDFIEEIKPEYVGISSLDNIGDKNYHTVYANLTDNKYNRIPGYFRKDVNLPFNTPQGKGRFIVLKRKNV